MQVTGASAPSLQSNSGAIAKPPSLRGSSSKPPPAVRRSDPMEAEVIDTRAYFRHSDSQKSDSAVARACPWVPTTLRPVPAFYPLEKSSRLVDDEPAVVASRLAECLRQLSVQARYDNDSAELLTAENVEMHLSLWKTPPTSTATGVVVELQRRKGDSITFHRYCRSILDAAVGDIEDELMTDDMIYSKRVQHLLSMEMKQDLEEHENAIVAIEIAHGLLMKDRMDARRLGLESLCLLTDPKKTGYITAMLTAHVVLLGSTLGVQLPGLEQQPMDIPLDEGPFHEIRETILGLVQFSRIGEDEHDDDMGGSPESEHMTILHNLSLAVLANALDVIENPDRYDDDEPEDTKPRARLRTASSNDVANEFLQQTQASSNKEMLSTLIAELGKAHDKPHDATLSAKCLGSLLRASDEAKRRAKELGAKMVVSTALDVGVRTHLKLETECKKVVEALERPATTTTQTEQEQNQDEL